MRELTLNFQSDTPLYEQLVAFIAQEIRAGRVAEGERLPSKRSLCEHLGVSRSTVETAYAILVAEGYARTRPRSGFYACAFDAPEPPRPAPAPPAPAPFAPEVYRYRFSTGEVDTSAFPYASWAKLNREVLSNRPELLQRGDKQGDLSLRRALCDFLHQYRGVNCRPDQIVVGAGMEYLRDVLSQLLGANCVYAVEDPGYRAVTRALINNGRAFVPIPLDESGMNPDALEASGASAAYVTPSHQFPTGITMPVGRRAQLLNWAALAPDRFIVEDDYDSEFRYATRPIPAMQGMDALGRVIYAGTFSRSVAPSIRAAYLVLPEALMETYISRFAGCASTVSRFEQQTLCAFLEQGLYARHLRRMNNLYRQKRNLLCALLGRLPGARLRGHDAGLHFLLTLENREESRLVRAARDAGVMVHGLSEYSLAKPCEPSTLVLGYAGLSQEQIRAAVALLAQAWGLPAPETAM